MMWILILMLVSGEGPSFQVYPTPFHSAEECQQALAMTEVKMTEFTKKLNNVDVKFFLKCANWGPTV